MRNPKEDLIDSIKAAVAALGTEQVRSIFQEQMGPPDSKIGSTTCINCDSEINPAFQNNKVICSSACSNCKTKNIVFSGKCRTLRQSSKSFLLRHIGDNGKEGLFDFANNSGSRAEMKSGDRFLIVFEDPEYPEFPGLTKSSVSIRVENITTGRSHKIRSARIHALKDKFPGLIF